MGVDFIWHLQDVEKKLDHTRDPPKRHIVITSYDLAQKLQGYERHFGMIICDESHALKTRTSNRTQFFRTMLARNIAKRVLFLTGTPALSRPIELYTQVCSAHQWLCILPALQALDSCPVIRRPESALDACFGCWNVKRHQRA